ncbi:septum formation initiator family protein [Streptomyces sp. NPDC052236]|uniref:septum formation initiator family protein n=1 Tax=Streptomyces sp. NPDC052236 TaxID=3365686 RepID=UPI0037CE5725
MSAGAKRLKGRAARLARLLPSGPSTAARTPFVLLVVLLLGGGLITLLILNSALNQGSFKLSELKKETTELTDEQQALQRDVDSYSAPDALERRARELGMVPGGSPAFLDPDGTVRGVPRKASGQPNPDPSPNPGPSPMEQQTAPVAQAQPQPPAPPLPPAPAPSPAVSASPPPAAGSPSVPRPTPTTPGR